MKRIIWDIKDWFRESETIDKFEEFLIFNKSKLLSKIGGKLWGIRRGF